MRLVTWAKPSPSMVVALAALVVALGGVAYAAIPGPDGAIKACYAKQDLVKSLTAPVKQFTEVATPAGALRVIDSGRSCGAGEVALTFNQRGPAGPAGTGSGLTVIRALRTATAKITVPTTEKGVDVLTATVPAGDYVATGVLQFVSRINGTFGVQASCAMIAPSGKEVPDSRKLLSYTASNTAPATFLFPITGYLTGFTAGKVNFRCRAGGAQGTTTTARGRLVLIKVR